MQIAILILVIFNIGLSLILGAACYAEVRRQHDVTRDRVDKDIECLGDAVFNMESLKAKAKMSGKAEL